MEKFKKNLIVLMLCVGIALIACVPIMLTGQVNFNDFKDPNSYKIATIRDLETANQIQNRKIDSLENVLEGAEFLIKQQQIKMNNDTILKDLDTIKMILKLLLLLLLVDSVHQLVMLHYYRKK